MSGGAAAAAAAGAGAWVDVVDHGLRLPGKGTDVRELGKEPKVFNNIEEFWYWIIAWLIEKNCDPRERAHTTNHDLYADQLNKLGVLPLEHPDWDPDRSRDWVKCDNPMVQWPTMNQWLKDVFVNCPHCGLLMAAPEREEKCHTYRDGGLYIQARFGRTFGEGKSKGYHLFCPGGFHIRDGKIHSCCPVPLDPSKPDNVPPPRNNLFDLFLRIMCGSDDGPRKKYEILDLPDGNAPHPRGMYQDWFEQNFDTTTESFGPKTKVGRSICDEIDGQHPFVHKNSRSRRRATPTASASAAAPDKTTLNDLFDGFCAQIRSGLGSTDPIEAMQIMQDWQIDGDVDEITTTFENWRMTHYIFCAECSRYKPFSQIAQAHHTQNEGVDICVC